MTASTTMRFFQMSVLIFAVLIAAAGFAAEAGKAPVPQERTTFRQVALQDDGAKAQGEAAPEVKPPAPKVEKGTPNVVAAPKLASSAVQLSSDGLLPGVIMVADRATGSEMPATELIVFFMQKGEVKATAKPGVAGVFQVKGLFPGRYDVIASGKSGYVATEVEVVAPAPRVAPVRLAEPVGQALFRSLAVPPTDLPMVLKLANSYVPPAFRTAAPSQLITDKDVLTVADLQSGYAPSGTPSATPETPYLVEVQAGGKVLGQLHRFHPQTGQPIQFHHLNVFLVQGESLPQKALVAPNGNFEFNNVAPGHYSVVGAGAEGFMAFGVHVVQGAGAVAAKANKSLIVAVSFKAKLADSGAINGTVIDPANMPEALRQLGSATAQSNSSNNGAPGGGGGAPGGGGGGTGGGGTGGGGGGLGLLGAALGAAGLGLAAANGNNSPSSP